MKSTVSLNDFREAFRIAGRQAQFSQSALEALFEYLEQYEEGSGEELELDPIGICCEFAEYASAREAAVEYGWDEYVPDVEEEEDNIEAEALKWLQKRKTAIELPTGGVVIQSW